MGLKSNFTNTKPRENAGAISSGRFDYQKDVSISLLLDHEDKGQDFIFLFDYHEDLVIMDSEIDPQKISFFQIKGKKTGSWSLTKMAKTVYDVNKNPLLSIIGKLYECRQKFIEETESLTFLSNAYYSFTLKDKTKSLDKDAIVANDICEKEQAVIRENLKLQLGLNEDPLFENFLHFKVLDISLNDSERHLKGILADFFQRKFQIAPDVNVIYKNFLSEIRKRSSYNKEIISFEDLVKNKAISKSTFTAWINHIAHQEKSLKEKWTELFTILQNEHLHFSELKLLKDGWMNYELISKDPNNQYVNNTIKSIRKASMSNVNSQYQMHEYMNVIYDLIKDTIPVAIGNEYTTKAMILNQLY